MRIERLDLLAFGPFTGVSLDFSAPGPGLHVVYGPNEAGKSTTLRALTGLLFGIPERTRDAHVHPMKRLRVGARLSSSGQALEIVRRKGRKGTLADPDGRVLDPSVLARFLHGLSRERFATTFALDHEALREGAEALLADRGDVGESLFDAGLGGRGVHRVLRELEDEAARIFTPQARSRSLNEAIHAYHEARRAVTDRTLTASVWHEQQDEIDRLTVLRSEIEAQREELGARRSRLQRALRVRPMLAARRELEEQRAKLGDLPDLPPDTRQRREEALRRVEEAQRELEPLRARIERLEARVAELASDPTLAALADDEVLEIETALGRHRAAQADLPSREAKLAAAREDVRRARRELGLAEDEDRAPDLVSQGRLRDLAERRRELDLACSHAAEALHESRARLAKLRARRREAEPLAEEAALLAPAAPSLDAIDEHAERLAELEREAAQAASELAELEARQAEVERDLDAERRAGELPSEEELAQARGERDRAWQAIRSSGEVLAGAAAFERAVARADELADRLRREAARFERRARLEAERASLAGRLRAARSRGEEVQSRREQLEARWLEGWRAAGVEPGSARAMHSRVEEARRAAEERARLDADVAEAEVEVEARAEALRAAEGRLHQWRERWGPAVEQLGLDAQESARTVLKVLDALGQLGRHNERVAELERRVAGMRRDSTHFEERLAALLEDCAPDLVGLPPGEAAAALVRRHRDLRRDQAERAELEAELSRCRKERERLQRELAAAEGVRDRLVQAAGVPDAGELARLEERVRRAGELDQSLARQTQAMLDAGDGATVEELAAEAGALDPDAARAQLEQIEEELERLDQERDCVIQELADTRAGLVRLERSEAPALAENAAAQLARVRGEARRYARVRLAAVLLRREIERYREQNQGPILERASELFPRLTKGRYARLCAGLSDDERPVLTCLRASGEEVGVEALSDGTRDQLYLALRVASIERYAAHDEPVPFVLDDVLIHFDDERARAALEVLAELSQSTQVLFFTHHERLRELACAAVAPERLVLHELGAPAP